MREKKLQRKNGQRKDKKERELKRIHRVIWQKTQRKTLERQYKGNFKKTKENNKRKEDPKEEWLEELKHYKLQKGRRTRRR